MLNQNIDMARDEFYGELISLIRDLKPGRNVPDPEPETHLWANGYVDSLGMLEIIYFLEERLGAEIELSGDFLPTFFTLKSIYDTYVAPAQAATEHHA